MSPKLLEQFKWWLEDRKQLFEDECDAISLEELQALDVGESIPHEEVIKRLSLE